MGTQQPKRRRHIARACARKTRFGRQKDAMREAQRLGMTFYKCQSCGGYHLTKHEG